MIKLKKANKKERENGWHYGVKGLQEISDELYEKHITLQIDEIDDILEVLRENNLLRISQK